MGDWRNVEIDGSPMRCYVAVPAGAGPFPAMAVLHGGFGFDDVTRDTVDRLAEQGIAAIGPDLFHRGEPERPAGGGPRSGSMKVADFVADVNGALAHMQGLPSIARERIGVMGFCMGGQTSYLLAGNNPRLKVAVCFYPGFVFNPLSSGKDPAPFDFSKNIRCPVIVFSGQDDRNPSPEDIARIDDALTQQGVTHEMHSYPNTAHAFMSEGTDAYREHAAKDAWPKALAFMRKHL